MQKLPILMYHSVTEIESDSKGLTVSKDKFESQLKYLKDNSYKSFHFNDLEQIKSKKIPKKSVIITFDDVYVNQLEYALPLLEAYNMKASFFIPFQFVGNLNTWDGGKEKIMSLEQLKALKPEIIELGIHSFSHGNYKEMSIKEVEKDLKKCKNFIENNDLNVYNILAYPYGKYPKKGKEQKDFFNCLKASDIKYGLRIGNRVNSFPFKNNYEIQRIDIKGEDSLLKFKLKMRFGKLSPF